VRWAVLKNIPTSQISQLTSTDPANGALQTGGYTVLIDPGSTISATIPTGTAGTPAQAVQAFVNAGGTSLGTGNGGAAGMRNAGLTTLNTNTISPAVVDQPSDGSPQLTPPTRARALAALSDASSKERCSSV
jgi:hypothetical protein